MIVSFGDKATVDPYHGRSTRRARTFPESIVQAALRKLDVLNAANNLNELASPPGNRLEALRGAMRGQWSIRINDQWRIVFRWDDGLVYEVKIVDYHRG